MVLSARRRGEIAVRLSSAGVTPQDIDMLAEVVTKSEGDPWKARRYLTGLLSDEERLRDALEGVRCFFEAQQNANRTHYPGFPVPYPTCGCDTCRKIRAKGLTKMA